MDFYHQSRHFLKYKGKNEQLPKFEGETGAFPAENENSD